MEAATRGVLVALLAGSAQLMAANPTPEQALVAESVLAADSRVRPTIAWDHALARPRRIHAAFAFEGEDRELAVRRFLTRHARLFGLDKDTLELTLTATREGRAGTYLRFGQRFEGLPVFAGEIVVLVAASDAGAEIRDLNLAYFPLHSPGSKAVAIDPAQALAAVRAAIGVTAVEAIAPEVVLGIDPRALAALSYRVRYSTGTPRGDWEAYVDARDGRVRGLRNRIRYADGTGMVFDPNPVASTGNTALVDNNDATSAALDAARFPVTLPRLDGTGVLRGSFVDARPQVSGQRATDVGLSFAYTRADNRFEEVMAYFHIDRVQQRIQSELGFTDVNNRVQVVVVNSTPADQSFYSPATKELSLGEGGVDDGEDADIIIHEYGHSIQDNQVPGFGGGDEGAMGEGFGDYLAGSMTDTQSQQVTDPDCIADWDAVSYSSETPPCLRRLDSTRHYPEFAVGEVHVDGEMWSAALFRARATLGADTLDELVLESHFLLSNDEDFAAGVAAIATADLNLNAGANAAVLRRSFVAQGLSRELSPPSPLTDVLQSIAVSIDHPRNGQIYPDLLDDTQSFTHAGAAALRVHFSQLQTELDAVCFAGACDNIYLYGAQGDLYQILNGNPGPTDSVVIPGDTVRIRLVTDSGEGEFGYHVDRIDVMAATLPPLLVDGFEGP